MPIVKGSIKSVSGSPNKFTSWFNINGLLYNATGTFSLEVPEFVSQNATLTYDDIGDLTSFRLFVGHVGSTDIKLTFDNGPIITGVLDEPIGHVVNVSGSASWSGTA